jgi:O-acetylserine/cysteine efflux transporter
MALSFLLDEPAARSHWTAPSSWPSWLAVVYLGWMATILAYTMWTTLLKRHGPNTVAPFSLGVPVVGIVSGLLLLGERITSWQWAGIVITVLALAYAILGQAHATRSRAVRPPP